MKAMLLMPFNDEFGNIHDVLRASIEECAKHFRGQPQPTARQTDLGRLEADRVDYGHGAVEIVTDLKRRILASEICVVDLTGMNQNVVWEFGFVHALEKPTIVITQNASELTFDLKQFRVLEYDRDNLRSTLQNVLVPALIDVLSNAPERASLPESHAQARTLAMATPSPTYFLDRDFRIQFMNQSALALFYGAGGMTTGEIHNRPLSEFLTRVRDQIRNLPSVVKTLYSQTEVMRRGEVPDPCSFETIDFESERFGLVELRKAGLAVRDPARGTIAGWVVSFNLTGFKDPDAERRFYEGHESIIKNELYSQSSAVAVAGNTAAAIRTPLRWHTDASRPAPDQWWDSLQFRWADSYDLKELAFKFALDVLLNSTTRYGLEAVHYLDEWFFDFNDVEYLIINHATTGQVLGVCRVNIRFDVSRYLVVGTLLHDLGSESPTDFADVGAYFPETLSRSNHRRDLVAQCLGMIMRRCEDQGCPFQYVQVPVQFQAIYQTFGFSQAGPPFRCPGWGNNRWVPMLTGPFWVNDDRRSSLPRSVSETYAHVVQAAFQREVDAF